MIPDKKMWGKFWNLESQQKQIQIFGGRGEKEAYVTCNHVMNVGDIVDYAKNRMIVIKKSKMLYIDIEWNYVNR